MTTADVVTLVIHDTLPDAAAVDACSVYNEAYAEAPYLESESDFEQFARDLPGRAQQPGFRLVIAYDGEGPVGFAMGHELAAGSRWWEGTTPPLDAEFVTEHPGRTFAVIELAVRAGHRRHGLGRRLHAHLTVDLHEERITLLVRPDAPPAARVYSRWGYSKIGRIQPFTDGPVYDLMLKKQG